MRISDWSSDVCSSDLCATDGRRDDAAMVLCGNLLEFEQYTGNVLEHAGRLPDVLGLVHAGEPVGELLRARMVATGRMRFLLVRPHRQQQARGLRSEGSRVGRECGSTCRYRWAQ